MLTKGNLLDSERKAIFRDLINLNRCIMVAFLIIIYLLRLNIFQLFILLLMFKFKHVLIVMWQVTLLNDAGLTI